ncbi:hypothetical protein B0J12DRAFT_754878 [Macrophomina phaseolina]|uniref:Uncharacterized protein n=1 Tax=Macrophomina phaseolina TaxID=35725 RepID=A0ABQ8FPC5_9PEZI|nr:hypothetical protein B0J12DRAFT_754878 [Macrophomina phaseolina]
MSMFVSVCTPRLAPPDQRHKHVHTEADGDLDRAPAIDFNMNTDGFDFDWEDETKKMDESNDMDGAGSEHMTESVSEFGSCVMIVITYPCSHTKSVTYEYCGGDHLNTPDSSKSCHNSVSIDKRVICHMMAGPNICENPCKLVSEGWYCCTCGYLYVSGVVHPVTNKAVHEADDGSIHMYCDECSIMNPSTYDDMSKSVVANDDMSVTKDMRTSLDMIERKSPTPTPTPLPFVPPLRSKFVEMPESESVKVVTDVRAKTSGDMTVTEQKTVSEPKIETINEPNAERVHVGMSRDRGSSKTGTTKRDTRKSMDYNAATYKELKHGMREVRHRLDHLHEDINKPKPKTGLASIFTTKSTNTSNVAGTKALHYTNGHSSKHKPSRLLIPTALRMPSTALLILFATHLLSTSLISPTKSTKTLCMIPSVPLYAMWG